MTSSRRLISVALAAGIVGVAGCGGGNSQTTGTQASPAEASIRQVVAQLGDLSRRSDGASICNKLLTRDLEVSIRRAATTGSCTTEVLRNIGDTRTEFTVQSVSVNQGSAVVRVTDQQGRASRLLMEQVGSSWRIARIG